MTFIKEALRYIAFPLLLLVLTLFFILLWDLLGLPDPDTLIQRAGDLYATYGYWIVFVGALAEGLIVAGWYLPGSVIIVLGVVFNHNNPSGAALVVAIVIGCFIVTTTINYALGRYGWYLLLLRFGLAAPLEQMRRRMEKHGLPLILFTNAHPNLGSLTATCCGVLRIQFRQFMLFTITSVVFWNTLWGILIYFTGTSMLKLLNMWVFVLAVALWVMGRIIKVVLSRRNSPN
jgi:membrane protein DedA with SNARE-associated domain